MLRSGYCPLEKNVEKLQKDQGGSAEIILADGNIELGRAKDMGWGEKGEGCHSHLQVS